MDEKEAPLLPIYHEVSAPTEAQVPAEIIPTDTVQPEQQEVGGPAWWEYLLLLLPFVMLFGFFRGLVWLGSPSSAQIAAKAHEEELADAAALAAEVYKEAIVAAQVKAADGIWLLMEEMQKLREAVGTGAVSKL